MVCSSLSWLESNPSKRPGIIKNHHFVKRRQRREGDGTSRFERCYFPSSERWPLSATWHPWYPASAILSSPAATSVLSSIPSSHNKTSFKPPPLYIFFLWFTSLNFPVFSLSSIKRAWRWWQERFRRPLPFWLLFFFFFLFPPPRCQWRTGFAACSIFWPYQWL